VVLHLVFKDGDALAFYGSGQDDGGLPLDCFGFVESRQNLGNVVAVDVDGVLAEWLPFGC